MKNENTNTVAAGETAVAPNYFSALNAINVSDKTEKKNGLTYLSWAWAWGELKKRHPFASYEVRRRDIDGRIYFDDGRTAWVEVAVTVPVADAPGGSVTHAELLPIMDARNRSIPVEALTTMDVNKAIQRALTKAIARHGLGLYIYAGEDLPESVEFVGFDSESEGARIRERLCGSYSRETLDALKDSLKEEYDGNAPALEAIARWYRQRVRALRAQATQAGQ